ncbi:hypothetical protein HS088_TW03G00854 [Tripterygium wilfordii]|uniref:Uncharacterized protein n=1 Tax=Tripterygium wilfordii TaxID=458696 RepID=A0A7J7DW24_TRIWF|nr:uncharacterized protein LOC119995701 [Tripterygium wilfordii]KAF5750517.1 hypothetical protein HS088_TW03G00854 [Tripterygium wilfordii]
MPQVDLETIVSACAGGSSDRKITCETLADTGDDVPPDFPPESFWLSKDAELEWFDRNAFIERKDSTKGNNANSANLNPNLIHGYNSSSQRFSHNLKSKASIFTLLKPQKPNYADTKNRRNCKQGNTPLFPKRSGSAVKSDSSLVEPSSPKVSCMGRVRSKRDRNRQLRNRQKSSERGSKKDSERRSSEEKPVERQRNGFFAGFRAIFRSTRRDKEKKDESHRLSPSAKSSATKTSDIRSRLPPSDPDIESPARRKSSDRAHDVGEPTAESVGLGGMKQFTSGRRAESWGTVIDVA